MVTRVVSLGLVLLGSVCGTSSVAAAILDGHWEGAIAQPAGELKIVVEFTTRATAVRGTFTLPASAVFAWPLAVTLAAPDVRFKLPTGVTFDGQLRGDTLSGTVPSPTGGQPDAFHLKREPAGPRPYKEEDVHFRNGGVILAATLRLPLARGRHPALFLLQGSGDADRGAESFYADYFARRGVATLVYDKRGTGSSGGDYRQESFGDFAADALAGVHYLQSRTEIDPKRVGLYGRSHGGIVAPLAASLSSDVSFVIVVSGTAVPPYKQVTYQAEAQMRRDGFSEAEIVEAVSYMNQKWEVARSGGEGWDRLQAATQAARDKRWLVRAQPATKLEDIVPSWKLQMGYDPMPALEGVKCPVLALFGELDTLTPVTETIAILRTGFENAGNRNHVIKVFPNADHALLVWPRPGDPSHWPVLAAGYLDTMADWITKQVAADK